VKVGGRELEWERDRGVEREHRMYRSTVAAHELEILLLTTPDFYPRGRRTGSNR